MTKETNKDYGLFNGDTYTYTSVRIYKDNDTRLSRKDSWCLKQINERIYLTTLQLKELRDLIDGVLNEQK